MTNLKARPTQTKVKHIILEEYLEAWGGIIVNGMRQRANDARSQGKPFDLHFVYVDCFSYVGRYSGELEDEGAGRVPTSVFGSPIIGVQILDKLAIWAKSQGVPLRVNAILIEQDPPHFAELIQTLNMTGLSPRVRQTQDFNSLKDSQIAVVQADSTTLATQLVNYTQSGYTFSFYLLDPYGPTGIPLPFVSQIIKPNRHDVIINMPYLDLHKKTGIASKGNLSPEEKSLIANYDAMFGHTRWQNIAQQLSQLNDTTSIQGQKLEIQLVDYYKDALGSVDSNLSVKSIPLRFPDKERTMFYLYLTTHDADGALQMNQILCEAGYQEDDLRYRLRHSKKQQGGQQTSFFDTNSVPPPPPVERDSDEIVGEVIAKKLSGRTLTRKEIYKAMADEPYFAKEINKALTSLKRKGRADYPSTVTNNTLITIK